MESCRKARDWIDKSYDLICVGRLQRVDNDIVHALRPLLQYKLGFIYCDTTVPWKDVQWLHRELPSCRIRHGNQLAAFN